MKAAIFTIFLFTLYLKTISPYLPASLEKIVNILAEGVLYSIFLVLALKI